MRRMAVYVPIKLDLPDEERKRIVRAVEALPAPGPRHRASLTVLDGESIVLRRLTSKNTRRSTKQGRALISRMASFGMVPVNGVVSGRQPDTWRSCARCATKPRCRCNTGRADKGRMVNVNDVIFVRQLSLRVDVYTRWCRCGSARWAQHGRERTRQCE
jgi:hypothetical protein